MTDAREDLGIMTDVAAALALVEVAGRALIDVGCGAGGNAEALHRAGARVLGVEPDPIQAEKNRALTPPEGLKFVEGRAEALPADDASMDGVLFFRSLHHVPAPSMDAALAQAARVLKPEGFLVVIEPGMAGGNFELMRLYHDETEVRSAAQAALARAAAPRFHRIEKRACRQFPRHASFDAFVARALGQTFNAIDRARIETDEVRAVFEAGRTPAGDYVFEQPMLIDVYRRPRRD